MRLNRTPYLWSLFTLGALSYLVQIRGQNVPLWIILFSLSSMVIVFALIIHVVGKKHANEAKKPPAVRDSLYSKRKGKPRSKK